MSKKVLVTGISGYVGQHCAVELLKNGYTVRGSVRKSYPREQEVTSKRHCTKSLTPEG